MDHAADRVLPVAALGPQAGDMVAEQRVDALGVGGDEDLVLYGDGVGQVRQGR